MPPDEPSYRTVLGHFATGVTIITAMDGNEPIGVSANSFTSVSLDPPLVSWSLRLSSALFEAFDGAGHFGVNVLAASQADLAARFATRCDDRFQGVEVIEGIEGLPLIAGSLATFECSNLACHVAGDHGIFIGKVERYTAAQRAEPPLVFCQGGYTAPRTALAT